MCGWHVKLCDPLVTYGPYLSALEIKDYIKRYINSLVYFTLLYSSATLYLRVWDYIPLYFNLYYRY